MVGREIRNEPKVRFYICDPILGGICDAWCYRTKSEESMKNQSSDSGPRHKMVADLSGETCRTHQVIAQLIGCFATIKLILVLLPLNYRIQSN